MVSLWQIVMLLITVPFLGAMMPFIISVVGPLYSQLLTDNPVAAMMAGVIPLLIVYVLFKTLFDDQAVVA